MLFNDALQIHRSATAEQSHPEILGDAFLLANNPLYRQIRLLAIDLDITLTEATLEYLLMPFNQLDTIVSTRHVPFVPNARLMAEIESKHPGVFDLEQMPLPGSYQMHESAHVIADHYCSKIAARTQEEKILKAILCESFANTVDAMACAFADSVTHQIFLKLNCYMDRIIQTREEMKKVSQALGEEFTARLILHSYVYANFLRDEPPIKLIEEWIAELAKPITKLTKKTLKNCVTLSCIGQRLDPLFRVQTAQNYFQLQGYRGEIYDLLDFDFAEKLQRKDFAEAIDRMISCLLVKKIKNPAG